MSAGCQSCQLLYVYNARVHESGCPDAWRDKAAKCQECGCDFLAQSRHDKRCADCREPQDPCDDTHDA